jgi:hypothetical protein
MLRRGEARVQDLWRPYERRFPIWWDRGFESAFLQQAVCLRSEPGGCMRKVPHFRGGLRVAGDVRGDVRAANRDSFALSL